MSYHPASPCSQVLSQFVQGATGEPRGMVRANSFARSVPFMLYRIRLPLSTPLFSPAGSPHPLFFLFRDSLFPLVCRSFGLARREAAVRAYRTPLVNILSKRNNRWPAHHNPALDSTRLFVGLHNSPPGRARSRSNKTLSRSNKRETKLNQVPPDRTAKLIKKRYLEKVTTGCPEPARTRVVEEGCGVSVG